MSDEAPQRGIMHDALEMFLGEWTAEGTSYGGTDQSGDPKAHGEHWISRHITRWHSGEFFLFQDERATIAGRPFDTFSVLGIDPESGNCFARTFENHGFYRDYKLTVVGDIWNLTGASERARTHFTDSGRTQIITWEWKRDGRWLPLCDRTATRTD